MQGIHINAKIGIVALMHFLVQEQKLEAKITLIV